MLFIKAENKNKYNFKVFYLDNFLKYRWKHLNLFFYITTDSKSDLRLDNLESTWYLSARKMGLRQAK